MSQLDEVAEKDGWLIVVAERLDRKGGREVVVRCADRAHAQQTADWLVDRSARLAPRGDRPQPDQFRGRRLDQRVVDASALGEEQVSRPVNLSTELRTRSARRTNESAARCS